jgi:beta-lactam-binding protein with PASTA domain
MPNLIGRDVAQAESYLRSLGFLNIHLVRIPGSVGEKIAAQIPVAGSAVSVETRILLYLG